MKKKILITGASGFIGSFLVEEALNQGYQVFAGVRQSSNKNYLQNKEIIFAELDFANTGKLQQQLQKITDAYGSLDYVIHNAGVTQSGKEEDFYKVNVEGTQHFTQALIELQIPLKKFVFISSLAAYGPGKEDFEPIETSVKPTPVSAYGNSKMIAEMQLKSTIDFPYVIINPTAVYGPRDKDFFEFIKLINSGWEPYLGIKKQMISLIYVKDLVKAIINLLSTNAVRESFIVSDGEAYDKEALGTAIKAILEKKTMKIKLPLAPIMLVIRLLESLYKISGKKPFLNREKLREISSANWLCKSDKFWEVLQTKPQYSLATGMKETIEWYKENRWLS